MNITCRVISFLTSKDMSLHAVSVIVCLFLACVAADTGVYFVMERHPDSYFCGRLQCTADLTKSDQDVSSLVEMTIYDITGVNSELRLASVSAFHPDLYVDTKKSSAVSCTGIISRLQANLTLQLRHDIDCLYGVYKCQLDFITEAGHPEVLTEIVIPEHNHSYSRVAEVISHIDKLTGLFNIHTTQVSNQSTEINKLESHLVDIASQMIKHTAKIDRLGNQTTILMDQTAEIDKLGRHLDHQTSKLSNQTAKMDKLGSDLAQQTSKLNDQTAEINKLSSRFDDLTAQLINQNAQLHNISQRLDLETTKQKQQHDADEKRLIALDLKLDTIQKLSNPLAEMFQNQDTCTRWQPSRNKTKRFTLWGNTTALCDTVTDGGGWIIIQRRTKGDVDFFKDWNEYKNGFGDLNTDFWIGNDVIHDLSQEGYNELRVEMIYQGGRVYAHYSNFYVASEATNYLLTVGGYSGTVKDSLANHNSMPFSTFDRDNDKYSLNCADVYKGAWWYNVCYHSNLNGLWGVQNTSGVAWHTPAGYYYVSFTEMKIRRG